MADTDYAPVTSPEEEEEERRRTAQEYPAAQAPAGAISAPVKEPPTDYPAVAPRRAPTIEEQMGKRPSPSDYPAADLHGWKKGLGALFTGMAAFRSPEAGEQVYKHLFVEPGEKAQQQYETASSDYDKQLAQKQAAAKEESESSLRGAQAEEAKARTANLQHPQDKVGNTPEELTLHYLLTGDNGKPITNPKTGKPYNTVEAYRALKEIGSETKPLGQEQNKLDFQAVAAKVDAAGLPTGPKEIDKSLDAALKRGVITADEHAKARAYQAANPTPGTNLTVHVAGAQQAQNFNASRQDIRDHDKAYVQPAEAVEKSYEMMDRAYQDYKAAKAQGKELPTGAESMLALSTHLATTFGNVKGARVTKDLIEHHLGARSISDSALVAIQKLTNGDVLSPDQWEAFHKLIQESRNLSWKTAVKEAHRKDVPVNFLPEGLTEEELNKPYHPEAAQGNEPQRPAHVPADYIYQEKGPQGKGWYKPKPKP